MTSQPSAHHFATVPAEVKSASSGWAMMTIAFAGPSIGGGASCEAEPIGGVAGEEAAAAFAAFLLCLSCCFFLCLDIGTQCTRRVPGPLADGRAASGQR